MKKLNAYGDEFIKKVKSEGKALEELDNEDDKVNSKKIKARGVLSREEVRKILNIY